MTGSWGPHARATVPAEACVLGPIVGHRIITFPKSRTVRAHPVEIR